MRDAFSLSLHIKLERAITELCTLANRLECLLKERKSEVNSYKLTVNKIAAIRFHYNVAL